MCFAASSTLTSDLDIFYVYLRKIQETQKFKNKVSTQYNFVPLSKVLDMINKKLE